MKKFILSFSSYLFSLKSTSKKKLIQTNYKYTYEEFTIHIKKWKGLSILNLILEYMYLSVILFNM